MKSLIIILSIFCTSTIVFSQKNTDSLNTNNINVIKDNRIDLLEETYKSTFKLIGYRVQIYSGNKKQPANQVRASFLRVHSKTKAHLDYQQPFYKVKVGDFKTKLEALKYKKFIAEEFPNSYIVKDEIDIDELN